MNSYIRKACFLAASVVCTLILAGCATDVNSDRGVIAKSESERVGWKGVETDTPSARTIAEGRRIAQSNCAACHAIDWDSVSRNSGAPPFRDLVFLSDPDWVAYRLIDGIRVGHDSMPLFDLDVHSADALMAYIKSIND
jgi:mono/diheme cytochrome c family protein